MICTALKFSFGPRWFILYCDKMKRPILDYLLIVHTVYSTVRLIKVPSKLLESLLTKPYNVDCTYHVRCTSCGCARTMFHLSSLKNSNNYIHFLCFLKGNNMDLTYCCFHCFHSIIWLKLLLLFLLILLQRRACL